MTVIPTTPKQTNPPQLDDVLEAAKRDLSGKLNCVSIGAIQTFNAARQTATVQCLIKQLIATAPDGTKTYQARPVVGEVPVIFLFGGAAHLTMPPQPGDECLMLFADRQIDEWFQTGEPSIPLTGRQHDFSDAIAIVGLHSVQKALTNFFADGVELAFDDAVKLRLSSALIESFAATLKHNGDIFVTGNATVQGNLFVGGNIAGANGTADVNSDVGIRARDLHAANGATGTYTAVTVVDGIVTGGSP